MPTTFGLPPDCAQIARSEWVSMEEQLAAQAEEIRKLRERATASPNAPTSPGAAWTGEIRGWTRRWEAVTAVTAVTDVTAVTARAAATQRRLGAARGDGRRDALVPVPPGGAHLDAILDD